MIYRCRSGSECKHTFTTERGLHLHRLACSHYKNYQTAGFAKRQLLVGQKKKVVTKARQSRKGKGRAHILDLESVGLLGQFNLYSQLIKYGLQISVPGQSSATSSQDVAMDGVLDDYADIQDRGIEETSSTLHSPFVIQSPLSPPMPASIVPSHNEATRPVRIRRIPARYEDVQPEGPAPLPPTPSLPPVAPGSYALPRVILHVRDFMRTGLNRFGLFREYHHRPSYDPDHSMPEDELSNCHAAQPAEINLIPRAESCRPPWPFQNMSIYLLMEWMITGGNQKSIGEVDRLAKDVLGSKDFRLEDIANFSAHKENKRLDSSEQHDPSSPFPGDGWIEKNVRIVVPTGQKDSEGLGQPFTVPGLQLRSLCKIMKSALADITSRRFHFSPFKRFWKSPLGSEVRCYDEAYTSDGWIEAHDDLQKQPNEPGCKLEKVILGLMFWSDSTHLTSFGTAKVWPLYMYFANLSKYIRCKPSSGASHHVAYIPSVCNVLFLDQVALPYCLGFLASGLTSRLNCK